MNPERKKINGAEYLIYGGGLFIFGDVPAIIAEITGVGIPIAAAWQNFLLFLMLYWLKSKGDEDAFKLSLKQLRRVIYQILPYIPALTLVFYTASYRHNHPKKQGLGSKLISKEIGKTKLGKVIQ